MQWDQQSVAAAPKAPVRMARVSSPRPMFCIACTLATVRAAPSATPAFPFCSVPVPALSQLAPAQHSAPTNHHNPSHPRPHELLADADDDTALRLLSLAADGAAARRQR